MRSLCTVLACANQAERAGGERLTEMVLYCCVHWHQQLNCLAPKFHCTRTPTTLQLASQSFFFFKMPWKCFFKRLQQSQKQPTKSILLPLCLHFYSVSAHTHITLTFSLLKLFCAHSILLTLRDWGAGEDSTRQDSLTPVTGCIWLLADDGKIDKLQTQ